MADPNNRTALWIAVIALVGTLGAAVITNWTNIFHSQASTSPNLPVQPSPDPHPDVPKPPPQLQLAKDSFEFPGDGQKNQNQTIGDFCCTGETATVQTNMGSALGYIYFYDFRGGINVGNSSAAEDFSVQVSGARDPGKPNSEHVRSSILFQASEMTPGTQKQTTAGILRFTATIEGANITNIPGKYMMDSVRCRVDVEISH